LPSIELSPPPPALRMRVESRRAGRFLARVDRHLRSISDFDAKAFLSRQIDGWEYRYARFLETDGTSEPTGDPTDPPQAVDFLLTIIGLVARRNGYVDHPMEPNEMSNQNRQTRPKEGKPLGSAVLSLLVAADQRCPAIIGQAHLLYHARLDAKPEISARTFAQLKRDAADLFQAIAAVERAMDTAARPKDSASGDGRLPGLG